MTNMLHIDNWTANIAGLINSHHWSMSDPRCREIFVEAWLNQNHKRKVQQYFNDSDDMVVAFITEHRVKIAYAKVDDKHNPWEDCIRGLFTRSGVWIKELQTIYEGNETDADER